MTFWLWFAVIVLTLVDLIALTILLEVRAGRLEREERNSKAAQGIAEKACRRPERRRFR